MKNGKETIKNFLKTVPGIIVSGSAAIGIVIGTITGIVDQRAFAITTRVDSLEQKDADFTKKLDEFLRISKRLEIMQLLQADANGDGEYTGSRSRQIMQLYSDYVKGGQDQYMAFEIDEYRKSLDL